jgi:5-formyltetrahydrofolate cyclo-ligase
LRAVTLQARRTAWGPSGEPAVAARARALALDVALTGAPVLLYQAFPDEPDLGPLVPLLTARGVGLALPRLLADGRLEAVGWDGSAGLLPGPRGTLAPAGPALDPGALAAVVAPALLVDPATGVRLGRGGGSYDRLLSSMSVPVIAALASADELVSLAGVAEPHDRPVTAVALPDGVRWL